MVEEGERSGALTPEKMILDASSGNTGIAYAWIGAVKGYRVQRAVPGNVSQERMGVEELAEEYAGQLMDITFLYWEECPSHAQALQRLRRVMAGEGIQAPVHLGNVETWQSQEDER